MCDHQNFKRLYLLSQCVYSFEVLVVPCSYKKGTPLMGLFVGEA